MRHSVTKEETVINLLQKNVSWKELNRMGFSNTFISKVSNYFDEHGLPPSPKKRGRKSKITQQMMSTINDMSLENRRLSSKSISSQISSHQSVSVSRATVDRIRHLLKFQYKPPKIIQNLDEEQKQIRLEFAYSLLNSTVNLDTIIFSDESRLSLGPDNRLLWRRFSDNDESVFMENSQFSPGFMIFGAIGIDFKSPIKVIKGTVNSARYVEILREMRLFSRLDSKFGKCRYIFQQDGATCHKAQQTLKYIKKKAVFISKWPSNSCDLNPIEMCWGIMKQYVKQRQPASIYELEVITMEAWNIITMETINALIRSFRYRLELVILNWGCSISDLIRRGIPETINLTLNIAPSNVILHDDLIEIPDFEDGDSEENPISEKPYCVVADLAGEMRPNFLQIDFVPELYFDPVPKGYMSSPFAPVPDNICRVINQVKDATTETKHSMKFCDICKIKIKDPPVHRRTMKHSTRANENIWREFDLIASRLDETDVVIQNNDDSC
jgi:transposase